MSGLVAAEKEATGTIIGQNVFILPCIKQNGRKRERYADNGKRTHSGAGSAKDTEGQTAPTMRKTIGGTTYIVTAHFSETSKEMMSDKICRMIKRDIESGNY